MTLRLLLQDLFNMIHSVSKEMITAIQCVPRIAERVTPAAAAHQKVHRILHTGTNMADKP